MTSPPRILGIDPGSRITGFGVIDCIGSEARYCASGAIHTADGDLPNRLKQIYAAVKDVVLEFDPDIVAIENVFMARNAQSALKLGQARSAALCATFSRDIDVFEYTPREVKQAVVGTGGATKDQVQTMIVALLNLDAAPTADAADALAVAVWPACRAAVL